MNEKISFEISWYSLWRVAVFVGLVLLFYLARHAIAVLLIAVVISLGLDPMISFLERRKVSRLLGSIIVFLVGLIILSTVFYFIIPIVIVEAKSFLKDLDKAVTYLFGTGLPQGLIKEFDISLDETLKFLRTAHVSITGAISSVVRKVVLVLATFIISFYLSIQRGGPDRFLRVMVPDIYERPVLSVFSRFKVKIRRWFIAQLGLSLVIGIVVSVGLWLLGVRYGLVLGFLAAILELVPIVGPIVAGAIAVLVALSESFTLGLYVFVFFIIVQQLENHILVPLIIGKAMKVDPVIVIFSLLAGSQVAGFVGIVLAVPIAVMSQEVFNYLLEKKETRSGLGI